MEMPNVNPKYLTKPYQYAYLARNIYKTDNEIVKVCSGMGKDLWDYDHQCDHSQFNAHFQLSSHLPSLNRDVFPHRRLLKELEVLSVCGQNSNMFWYFLQLVVTYPRTS
jgi:hypothetical protein